LSTDKTYGGRYTILEPVGAGGMAEVYRGRDQLLGREVAVKVLSERFAQDHAFVERFRREAQSAANLNHPNIVSLYDYGSDGDAYYIVMEFIEGRSLADALKEEGRVLPERAAEIAADVAKALGRAHGQGIVHRDIKPGNIMLTSSGQTKVTDFGIARALGGDGEQTMTQTGMVIGTAAYLSPEQAQGNPVDARSDIYSIGIVLYEMLAGNAPFAGDTPLSIAYKHVREDPPPLTTAALEVPPALASIAMKALAKNPENRYASAQEMQEDLERFTGGQTVLATPMLADETLVAPATGTQVLRQTDIYEEEDEPEERRTAAYVIGALVILALLGLLVWFLARGFGGTPVEVPNVVGKQIDEASRELREAGLEVSLERRFSGEVEVDHVIETDPEAGETVNEGDTVIMFVSRGVRRVTVPNVVGMPLDEAEKALQDERLRVGEVTEQASDDVPEGEVISQSVAAGTEVNARTEIDLTVSSGAGPVVMPNVVGQTQSGAESTLEGQGLVVNVQTVESDSPEGIVVEQDPETGTELERGETVTIVVSEGPGSRPMPDMTGQEADDAEDSLEDDFGLNVSQVDETQACAQPPGRVCRQEPAPGTQVRSGDRATLYVQPGSAWLERIFLFAVIFGF
jgi:serine/threonine-protein kinase